MAHPDPGRIGAVHRLNRAEYNNAIRDLFALDVDVKPLLPGDDTADGSFDNFADSLSISTAHLERYMSVARQVTRLATGLPPTQPALERFEIPLHVLQEDRQSEDLPFGSRGGMAIHYDFPVDGEYLVRVRLQRQYQDYLKGMGWPQTARYPPGWQAAEAVHGRRRGQGPSCGGQLRRRWRARVRGRLLSGKPTCNSPETPAWKSASPSRRVAHVVGVSFVREMWEPEGLPQPVQLGRVIANDQVYMGYANVGSVQIGGPYEVPMSGKDPPEPPRDFRLPAAAVGRRTSPKNGPAPPPFFREWPGWLIAGRRPKRIRETLLQFFDKGRKDGGNFDSGIQFALERMLVDPDFLLRVHRDPARPEAAARPQPIALSDLELASRLSFFLWSSIPDDRLLTLAEHGELTNPVILDQEVRRMLADPRATDALVNNFAAQWLNLRRIEEVVVDPDKYPLYDESLLQAFQTGNRDVRGQQHPRGPPRARTARCELHLPQRAAGAANTGFPEFTAADSAA